MQYLLQQSAELMHNSWERSISLGKFRDKGVPVDNISNYDSGQENIIFATSQTKLNLFRVLFATKLSMLKVVDGGEFDVAKKTVAATKLMEQDEVVSVEIYDEQKNIILQTKDGVFLRFALEEIPEKKKGAVGVRGMKLSATDEVEAVYYTKATDETVIEYKGKQIELNKLKLGKRDTKGVKVRI